MQHRQGLGIQVIVNGRPLPEVTKDGKTFIAAPWNTNYSLRFLVPYIHGYKYPAKRFLAVTSVDGLNIRTGRRATRNDGGWVITPPSGDVPGFYLNAHEVAAFRFGGCGSSYASQMDRPENVGAISVIFFSEVDPEPYDCLEGMVSKGGPCSFGPTTRSAGGGRGLETLGGGHDMGTEFGERQQFHTNTTEFERDVQVAQLTIEYASEESLINAGILPRRGSPLGHVDPFADGGCQPPPGYRG